MFLQPSVVGTFGQLSEGPHTANTPLAWAAWCHLISFHLFSKNILQSSLKDIAAETCSIMSLGFGAESWWLVGEENFFYFLLFLSVLLSFFISFSFVSK